MNNNDFYFKRRDKGIAEGKHKIIFKTPDGKIYEDCEITVESDEQYHRTCVVNLTSNDKIKPKFKAGNIVTNISELYPNVKCTISKVDCDKQCYHYKEVGGITYFKDQDKLMLVKDEGVRPPVEDEDKSNILSESYAWRVEINVLKYNIEHYPLIYNALKQIIAISKEGAISYRLVVPMKKEADEAGIYYEEDEVCGIIRWHFDKLGYKIKETIKENEYNGFFITW